MADHEMCEKAVRNLNAKIDGYLDRIAELEAEVTRWRDRYADAMAKLARVAERAERKHPVENDTAKMADGVIRNIEEISNILADTPKEVE